CAQPTAQSQPAIARRIVKAAYTAVQSKDWGRLKSKQKSAPLMSHSTEAATAYRTSAAEDWQSEEVEVLATAAAKRSQQWILRPAGAGGAGHAAWRTATPQPGSWRLAPPPQKESSWPSSARPPTLWRPLRPLQQQPPPQPPTGPNVPLRRPPTPLSRQQPKPQRSSRASIAIRRRFGRLPRRQLDFDEDEDSEESEVRLATLTTLARRPPQLSLPSLPPRRRGDAPFRRPDAGREAALVRQLHPRRISEAVRTGRLPDGSPLILQPDGRYRDQFGVARDSRGPFWPRDFAALPSDAQPPAPGLPGPGAAAAAAEEPPPLLEPPVLKPPVLKPPVLNPRLLKPPVLEPPAKAPVLKPPVLKPRTHHRTPSPASQQPPSASPLTGSEPTVTFDTQRTQFSGRWRGTQIVFDSERSPRHYSPPTVPDDTCRHWCSSPGSSPAILDRLGRVECPHYVRSRTTERASPSPGCASVAIVSLEAFAHNGHRDGYNDEPYEAAQDGENSTLDPFRVMSP
uniref:SH2 domain-containing protein n=1 Tax=Macrostomum lignano TaxID=282301 RepID=A0A1I8JS79_9PLAT